ncbi:embryonic ectoderm development protein [Grosmannia clavigera kw1407]|uniref:Embryonic ectoderm development protein n=1 Tax=Grosmannia clavigera (strain kw1407 / UAMH 11150) TaxID=655863 RepID=F0XUH9_GROCL|nr:embryonic ectoderm development protein [Grosmannia clavigera kw1407]EFW98560.1 embryonic ectoderm development protein [Grosmannia clavigera kw1407]
MAPPPTPLEWELPKLRYSLSFEDDKKYVDDVGLDTDFFDVKFYPYSPAGSNPVFAAVSKRHTKDKDANPCEVIQIIRDDDLGALNCSCTWTKDPETDRALLCVAGRDSKVKVYNIRDGTPVTSFVGHGGEINDLATSPANPCLIASASDDTTVRIWSLDPVHRRQPCVCLLAGEGHSWNLLSVAFHDSGRYVLSAGHDQVINLWTLPDFPQEHIETPFVVHYPHFSTSEIHTGLIDCVSFFGDLILSRACHEDVIVLWCIEGFSSLDDAPSPEQAPSNHDTSKLTRSSFSAAGTVSTPAGSNGPTAAAATAAPSSLSSTTHPQYTRLLQLHTPGCGSQFFTRFGLFNVAGHHPTLAFCNTYAKIFFWDFACFPAYQEFIAAADRVEASDKDSVFSVPVGSAANPNTNTNTNPVPNTNTPDPDTTHAAPAAKVEHYNAETLEDWHNKYDTSDPHAQLKAHKTEGTSKALSTVGRQVAWSPEGDWCVVVGSNSQVLILQRWANGEMAATGETGE